MKRYIKDIPKLVSEYHFDKNQDINFNKLTHGSGKKVWWKCKKCRNEWKTTICHKSKGSGCPYCSGKKVCKDNCLATSHPELVKEWNYSKNSLKPTEVTYGSVKRVWWICSEGHEWICSPNTRTANKNNCPYCAGRKVNKNNCLSTTHPYLLKEWSAKNIIKPTEVSFGSHKKVWWTCSKGHEWKTSICHRVNNKNCPYCSGNKVCKDNCLSATHSELAKEWNIKKNKMNPTNVTYGSTKKVWWECKKCNYSWCCRINDRSSLHKSGCPKCNESKGEKLVSQILDKLQVRYKREYKFKELGQKRFDFALFKKYKRKPYAVIEYHGRQHYEPVRFGTISRAKGINNFKLCKKRDKIKKKYCISNNIKYLEINYKEKENIEQLIRNFME